MLDPLTLATATRPTAPTTPTGHAPAAGGAGPASFADTLQASVGDVARIQLDADTAVTDLATGKTADLSGVMTAVEKSDLAFKTLLAIRSKLIDAYDEVKSMPM